MDKSVILLDGDCNMCRKAASFIMKKDKNKLFEVLSNQSEPGKKILTKYNLQPSAIDSVMLVDNCTIYSRSEAIIKISENLIFPWNFFSLLKFAPAKLRNHVYTIVAKYRYRLFGRSDSCEISGL